MQINDTHSGVQGWIDDLKALEKDPHSAFKDRLDSAVHETCEAIRDVMPVRTGALKASGSWSSEMVGDTYAAEISFGGELAPYAPYVVGEHKNGIHAYDEAWSAGQELIAAEVLAEFPALAERQL